MNGLDAQTTTHNRTVIFLDLLFLPRSQITMVTMMSTVSGCNGLNLPGLKRREKQCFFVLKLNLLFVLQKALTNPAFSIFVPNFLQNLVLNRLPNRARIFCCEEATNQPRFHGEQFLFPPVPENVRNIMSPSLSDLGLV